MREPKYIIIDGPDGCGKTTLTNRLKEEYPDFVYVKEPGDKRFESNTLIRQMLLHNKQDLPTKAIVHLMIADRIILQEFIQEQLKLGKTVISDRSFCSTIAYQQDEFTNKSDIINMHKWYFESVEPTNIVLLNISAETRKARMKARNEALDNMESKSDQFFDKVIENYRCISHDLYLTGYKTLADKITYLDANKDAHSVYEDFVTRFL